MPYPRKVHYHTSHRKYMHPGLKPVYAVYNLLNLQVVLRISLEQSCLLFHY